MTTFKIRGERLLNALDWMTRVDQERRRHPGCYLPENHPAYALAARFEVHGILGIMPAQLLWPDVRELLARNPQFTVSDLEIGGLIETLELEYRRNQDGGPGWWRQREPGFELFKTFLKAVACGEVTEGDLQT